MTKPASFQAIADSLRAAILDYYRAHGQELSGPSGMNTLETNSGWVARRSLPLLDILRSRGIDTVQGLRVIDLGCGFGAMSVFFAACGATVLGVDPHASRLEVGRSVAAHHGLDAGFQTGRMESLDDVESGAFDVALHNNSFCYIIAPEDRHAALRETLRVLAPGGWLVARNPNRWSPYDQFTKLPLIHQLPAPLAGRIARALGRERSNVRLKSPPAARRELRAAGFTEIRQAGFVSSDRPDALKLVARYQHFTARRPPEA